MKKIKELELQRDYAKACMLQFYKQGLHVGKRANDPVPRCRTVIVKTSQELRLLKMKGVMLNYAQAKEFFNSYIPEETLKKAYWYLPHIYEGVMLNGPYKGTYDGIVLMWAKNHIPDGPTANAITELKAGWRARAIRIMGVNLA